MSGFRHTQPESFVIIGSKTSAGSRTGVQLESTYSTTEVTDPTKSFKVAGYSKLVLNGLYEMGSAETANTIEVKIESSPDKVNWYPLSNDNTNGGTSEITNREFTFTGSDGSTAPFEIYIDISYEYLRISCKESGVASNKGNVFMESTILGI